MAFRVPFNEHLVIEADTAAEVRALITEFGAAIGPRPLLPAAQRVPIVDAVSAPRPRKATRVTVARVERRAAPRPAEPAAVDGAADTAGVGAQLMKALAEHGALSTGALFTKAKASSPYSVRVLMERLATKGLVHSTGVRRSQRWHLGAQGSGPKEAESRRR